MVTRLAPTKTAHLQAQGTFAADEEREQPRQSSLPIDIPQMSLIKSVVSVFQSLAEYVRTPPSYVIMRFEVAAVSICTHVYAQQSSVAAVSLLGLLEATWLVIVTIRCFPLDGRLRVQTGMVVSMGEASM